MGNVVTIDDGLKTYDIQNKEGKILGQFSFNPGDTGIVKRYNKALENFEKVFSEIDKIEDDAELEQYIDALDAKVYEFVDSIFDADIASNFFSIMGPFSLLESGSFFVENVLDVIGSVIQSETGERVQKLDKKIKKHTAKYHK